ncbi:VanZ family protein [Kitasatospora sp. NBC_01539]|uniref:VanZ family protein n=1 Tax=Kitasatospora sp. NBC_01539 TaxID=2903577 RepID=UPI0038601DF1
MNTQFDIPAPYVLGPALVLFALHTTVRRRRRAPGWQGGPLAVRALTALYCAAVAWLTFFPLWVYTGAYRNQMPWTNQLNPIPLLTADATMLPNVIMFIPLGFLLPLLTRCTGPRQAATLAALASLLVEGTQFAQYLAFGSGRAVDVNDLIANTLGGLLGHTALHLSLRITPLRNLLERCALPGSRLRHQQRHETTAPDAPDVADAADAADRSGRSAAAPPQRRVR